MMKDIFLNYTFQAHCLVADLMHQDEQIIQNPLQIDHHQYLAILLLVAVMLMVDLLQGK